MKDNRNFGTAVAQRALRDAAFRRGAERREPMVDQVLVRPAGIVEPGNPAGTLRGDARRRSAEPNGRQLRLGEVSDWPLGCVLRLCLIR